MSHHVDPMYKLIDTVLQSLGLEQIEFYVIGSSCQNFPHYFLRCMGTFLSTCVPYLIIVHVNYILYMIYVIDLTKISLIFHHCIWNCFRKHVYRTISTSLGLLNKFI